MLRVIICGAASQDLREELIRYYSYRGKACYSYDYLTLLRTMYDNMETLLQNEGFTVYDDDKPRRLCALYDMFSCYLVRTTQAAVKENTGRWQDLKMDFMTLIWGVPTEEDLKTLSCADIVPTFRVLLRSDGSRVATEGHPLEVGFNDCAVSDIFDIVVDTDELTPEEMANLIGDKLHDKLMTRLQNIEESVKQL